MRPSPYIDDATPFFADGCRMFVLLARSAKVGVILRRGPTRWWHITRWDTRKDRFESGQWFHGRIYPEKCDLSPNGELLIYFAAKFWRRDSRYQNSWTAVSRPPYLTALALWPMGGTYGGDGIFVDDRTVEIGAIQPGHHRDHPPGPLRVLPPRSGAAPCWLDGWRPVLAPGATSRIAEYRKSCGDLTLGREVPPDYDWPSRRRTLYTLYRPDNEPLALFEAHWAGWDHRLRLVATVGGRVLAGKLTRGGELRWRQLADLHAEKPIRMESPRWAQRW